MRAGYDVIVIGGGIVGASTAFFLNRRGRSVIVFESGLVGQQASGTNFGNVRRQGRFLPQLPLANRSLSVWGRLPELLGEDAEFLATGHLRICYDQQQVAYLEDYAEKAREYGLDLKLFSQSMLRRRFPFIGPEPVAGSYSPHDGHANPRLAAPAFARAAQRGGVKILENTTVASAEKIGLDFEVETHDGQVVRAPILFVAAGAWSGSLSRQFGYEIPLVSRGPQMAVTEPLPYTVRPVLGVSSKVVEEIVYLRQIPRGNVIVGGGFRGPANIETRRAAVEPENTLRQIKQVQRLVPGLSSAHLIRVWSGIEGYLPDDIPVMGASSKVSGLYYAFGFCGHGFQLGPGVGEVMAELIATGQTSTPIRPFSPERFRLSDRIEAGSNLGEASDLLE